MESTFVNVFLATYRTFAKPDQILDLLLQRYERLHADSIHEPLAEEHKKSLVSALHVWMDGYLEDWNQQNLKKIIAFTSSRLSSSEIHYKALNRLDKLARARAAPSLPWDTNEYGDYAEQFSDLCLTPAFLPPAHLLQAYRFPHIPVKHFAEQLTRMDMVTNICNAQTQRLYSINVFNAGIIQTTHTTSMSWCHMVETRS